MPRRLSPSTASRRLPDDLHRHRALYSRRTGGGSAGPCCAAISAGKACRRAPDHPRTPRAADPLRLRGCGHHHRARYFATPHVQPRRAARVLPTGVALDRRLGGVPGRRLMPKAKTRAGYGRTAGGAGRRSARVGTRACTASRSRAPRNARRPRPPPPTGTPQACTGPEARTPLACSPQWPFPGRSNTMTLLHLHLNLPARVLYLRPVPGRHRAARLQPTCSTGLG